MRVSCPHCKTYKIKKHIAYIPKTEGNILISEERFKYCPMCGNDLTNECCKYWKDKTLRKMQDTSHTMVNAVFCPECGNKL